MVAGNVPVTAEKSHSELQTEKPHPCGKLFDGTPAVTGQAVLMLPQRRSRMNIRLNSGGTAVFTKS